MKNSFIRLRVFTVLASIAASNLVGMPEANTQDKRQEPDQTRPTPREHFSLDIYNFVTASRGSAPDSNEGVSEALGDALLLQLFGQPRFQVRRIRDVYSLTPLTEPKANTGKKEEQVDASGPVRYVLSGTVGVFEPPSSIAPGSEGSSASHFVIIKYWLRAVGGGREPELLLDADEATGLNQLSIAVKHIADRILLKLVPPTRVRLRTEPVELLGFPPTRKSFFLENLTELLQAELQSVDWTFIVTGKANPDYIVEEKAFLREGKYELNARMFAAGHNEVLMSFLQSGPEQEILAGQFRVAHQILEELDTRRALVSSGAAPSAAVTNPAALLMAAKNYDETDPDLAIPLYRRVVQLEPTNVNVKLLLARALLHEQQPQEVLKVLHGSEIDESGLGRMLRSGAYALISQWEEALAEADRAVELSPSAVAYWWRGHVKTYDNNLKEALSDYQKALSLKPSDSAYYEAVAHGQEDLKNYSEAVKVLEEGRKRATDGEKLAQLQNLMRRKAAWASLQSGDPKEALPFAQAAAAEEPKSEASQRVLGTVYLSLTRLPEAKAAFVKALALEETPESLAGMAWVYLQEGNRESAGNLAMKSIVRNPEQDLAYQLLVQSVTTNDEAMQAVRFLRTISGEHPHSFKALEAWDFLQLRYMPEDQAGLQLLDSAYGLTLKTVPYKDWPDGWSNMVELAMVSGRADQALDVARDLLATKPSLDRAVTLQFYLWLALAVQQRCAQDDWNAFANLLSLKEASSLRIGWDFTATRHFMHEAARTGRIDEPTYARGDAAINLLGGALSKEQIDRFLLKYPPNKDRFCP